MPRKYIIRSDDLDEDETPPDETVPPANLNLDELAAYYGVAPDLKRERSVGSEEPDARPTVRRRVMNFPEPEPEADGGKAWLAAEEPPEPAAAEEPERRFRLYITVNAINYELPLEDEYYEDETTYRNIIEEVQTILRREIAGYRDNPSTVQLRVIHVRGIPETIHLDTLNTVDNLVEDGDVIYATPLGDDDTIARALRDPTTAALFHKQMQVNQNQGQRKYGGKTRKRLRNRKRNCSKKCKRTNKRSKKRKRSTRKRR